MFSNTQLKCSFDTGIFVSIGPILMEPQDPRHIHQRVCARARQILLLKWLVTAFFVTLSYKQVLLANLVDVGYEEPLETLWDAFNSGKTFVAPKNSYFPILLAQDPRLFVKKLATQVKWSNYTGKLPDWFRDG